MTLPNKKYNIIYADPPWTYKVWSGKGKEKKSAENHYDCMDIEDIYNLGEGTETVDQLNTENASNAIFGPDEGGTPAPKGRDPYGEELDRCHRYYQHWASDNNKLIGPGAMYDGDTVSFFIHLTKEMRATPSCVQTSGTDYYGIQAGGDNGYADGPFILTESTPRSIRMYDDNARSLATSVQGDACVVKTNNAAASIAFNAEL